MTKLPAAIFVVDSKDEVIAIAEAKQIVEAAGQDLGPFMDNPELAAKLQAALRLLTGQGGRPQQGGAPPR
jgi:hypothetical protein